MRLFVLALCLAVMPLAAAAFDHEHQAWSELLGRHVVPIDGGKSSTVRYAGFASERAALNRYLETLSRVSAGEYRGWSKPQQLAFLINAYNAFTIEKILTRYPELKSIRDFGTVFGNPWKDRFFTLLGREMHLDDIEHDTIRAPGAFEDPRIHFAVNCASIGCPALREEAYVAPKLERQLEEQTVRFLSDRSRNRYQPRVGRLEVSSIFDWYGKDFARGWKGYHTLEQFFSRYAEQLAADPAGRALVRERKAPIAFLDYDWGLNDAR